jgi:hypothetical protein
MIMGDGSLKLSEFGLGWRMDSDAITEWSGDVRFRAPEVVGKEAVSPACDVWSLGVLLYGMVEVGWGGDWRAGPPTPFQNQFEIVRDPAPPLGEPRCSAKIGLIFNAMLKKNPSERPLAVEVETQFGGHRLPTLLWLEPDLVYERCREVLDRLRGQWGSRVSIIGCESDNDVFDLLQLTDPDATFVATSWRELDGVASSAVQLVPRLRAAEVTGDILIYSDAVPPQARLPAGVVRLQRVECEFRRGPDDRQHLSPHKTATQDCCPRTTSPCTNATGRTHERICLRDLVSVTGWNLAQARCSPARWRPSTTPVLGESHGMKKHVVITLISVIAPSTRDPTRCHGVPRLSRRS